MNLWALCEGEWKITIVAKEKKTRTHEKVNKKVAVQNARNVLRIQIYKIRLMEEEGRTTEDEEREVKSCGQSSHPDRWSDDEEV